MTEEPPCLALRRIVWDDGSSRPDDYNVIYEGVVVGRVYRMNSTGRETWRWTQIGVRAPTHGPNGGIADCLDEAKAAFKTAWETAG
jgi:hypothetical protein